MSPLLVIDTPEGINAYRLLALKGALKLETKGLSMSRGIRASVAVRKVLSDAGKPASRNLVSLLAEYETHLRSLGILSPLSVA